MFWDPNFWDTDFWDPEFWEGMNALGISIRSGTKGTSVRLGLGL